MWRLEVFGQYGERAAFECDRTKTWVCAAGHVEATARAACLFDERMRPRPEPPTLLVLRSAAELAIRPTVKSVAVFPSIRPLRLDSPGCLEGMGSHATIASHASRYYTKSVWRRHWRML